MDAAQSNKANWSLLLDVGYLAMSIGLMDRAAAIFKGLAAYRPASEHPVIGLALTMIHRRHPTEAADLLRNEALKRNPESDIAQGVLGLALKMSGNKPEAEKIFAQVVKANRDPAAVQFAQAYLAASKPVETSPLTSLVP